MSTISYLVFPCSPDLCKIVFAERRRLSAIPRPLDDALTECVDQTEEGSGRRMRQPRLQ
jgi:hypothetical protein